MSFMLAVASAADCTLHAWGSKLEAALVAYLFWIRRNALDDVEAIVLILLTINSCCRARAAAGIFRWPRSLLLRRSQHFSSKCCSNPRLLAQQN